MTHAAADRPRGLGDRGLTRDASYEPCVRDALAAQLRRAVEIDRSEALPSGDAGSYRIELLTVRLDTGERLQVFLKDFGSCKYEKNDMPGRRRRELYVYRELLSSVQLGTPRYHGAVWDEESGRYWLLLEYVEGETLRYQGFERWLEAAGWLGKLQGRFHGRALVASDVLVIHDAAFFSAIGEQAFEAVEAVSSRLAARLRAALARYEELIPLMTADRTTLVHGVYRPYNILVRRNYGAGAICVTDWEEAGLGSPLYDLAQLADGFDRSRLDALIDAYEHELAAAQGRDRDEALRLLHSFNLHRNLKTLTKASKRNLPRDGVAGLVARVNELARATL